MKRIAIINEKDRQALFQNTAARMGLPTAIIEKDFWVCYMLDYLFNHSEWKNKIAFKGGTSLSKAFGLIERFSEDIDLILDWRVLGYELNEPWQERSNTKQDAFNKEANERTEKFLCGTFLPSIKHDLQIALQNIDCYIDNSDSQTVIFSYKNDFNDEYVLPIIRLEIGALAAWTPAALKRITPYAAQEYPKLFMQPSTEVLTVLPERTFWEKVTILHREANRSENSKVPPRYSRHYYDLYRMAKSDVRQSALCGKDLLEKVVAFKDKFYRCSWAKYDEAKFGTIKLLPPKYNIATYKADYAHMQNMIFGEKPTFDYILSELKQLEHEINGKRK